MPCFVYHRETPQDMRRRATDLLGPDLDRLSKLLTLDRHLIHSRSVEPLLFNERDAVSAERLRVVAPALVKPLKPLVRWKVKHRIAGFVSYLGELFGCSLEGPEIRYLFDLRAKQADERSLGDPELPDTPGSLQKMLVRQRAE